MNERFEAMNKRMLQIELDLAMMQVETDKMLAKVKSEATKAVKSVLEAK